MQLLIAVSTLTLTLFAATPVSGPQGRRGPPPEALEACQNRTDGDACSFESPRGRVEGTCWRPEASLPLACRPANAPRR